ncbi:MAG TPA: cation transporter [Acidobacteriaceae bacterium]|jgi:copper chaperone CopZ|nr:cation transporter [Acidobacteriaceae bacterium]
MRDTKLRIENMHCDACVRRVRQALEKVEGVQVGDVHVGGARVEAPETMPASALVSAVEKAGYPATVEA